LIGKILWKPSPQRTKTIVAPVIARLDVLYPNFKNVTGTSALYGHRARHDVGALSLFDSADDVSEFSRSPIAQFIELIRAAGFGVDDERITR
jgi:hypothetical protein